MPEPLPHSPLPVPPLPCRVLVAMPPRQQLAVMRAWLDRHCGPSAWASAPAGRCGVLNDAVAFYFADRTAARAFVARFSCGYRPAGPSGLEWI